MDLLLMFVISMFVFNLGFIAGAWWYSVCATHKTFEEEFAKEIKENAQSNMKVCERCGSRYDTESSEDETVCQSCVEHLKSNPDDEYLKKWRYE